jgi:hypothetical protein
LWLVRKDKQTKEKKQRKRARSSNTPGKEDHPLAGVTRFQSIGALSRAVYDTLLPLGGPQEVAEVVLNLLGLHVAKPAMPGSPILEKLLPPLKVPSLEIDCRHLNLLFLMNCALVNLSLKKINKHCSPHQASPPFGLAEKLHLLGVCDAPVSRQGRGKRLSDHVVRSHVCPAHCPLAILHYPERDLLSREVHGGGEPQNFLFSPFSLFLLHFVFPEMFLAVPRRHLQLFGSRV